MFGKFATVALISVVAWTGFARPSEASSPDRAYVVRSGDTLWTIAARHYAGDPRESVWRLRQRNELAETSLHPGQILQLP
jgi:LysM repeat protein